MHTWFECKIKYEKVIEEGKTLTVNETYLIDALSFTEAEKRIIQEMEPYISGDFLVANIRRARINEIFAHDGGDRWYRCKVFFISLDEEKSVEKRTAVTMLVQATSVKEAIEVLTSEMKNSLVDYELVSVSETPIMEVYPYVAEEKKVVQETSNFQ
ncbi:MAG: DUF4494 domain-containing protein [Paludibacteraceae bacterium]|jgi:hypothetical protein|nr:DUF4494 domain-containing protein [Paludibacteraceae bacterium]OPZ02519.1 MAG: hypothetical protein BWZ11_00845 [Bacteroidetes bacterium ADurb.BinA395]HOF99014.1 DUF4494 domain-containing protein [Paludibacteraceae bacterium]HOJ65478.1 DUF4494 domain-containing protein [Paludibacteraceae bacterium]HOL28879.1 DUF4494 domain-containing protein [Paludibacteraceae bacterium]